ncbi:MAG: hypothetical protein HY725_14690 [Candidatus Rokubacteria bacterium]|nr:hypothetical protein [Candidatus Rokubacteria bacterium]
MAVRVVRLGDPNALDAPFRFKKGDRVAWKRWDGSPDIEFSGTIVSGICEYVPGGGAYRDRYVIERKDGFYFGADQLDLIKLE